MKRLYGTACLAVLLLSGPAVAAPQAASGVLPDGTSYLITVPDGWNGVVISDLDYVGDADKPLAQYLLGKGYALSGIGRHPRRRDEYDPVGEINNLMTVLDMLKSRFGAPKRVIQYGHSGGGFVGLGIAETQAERVDGVVATCAHTPLLTSSARYDLFTPLKALLAPDDATLLTAGFPRDGDAQTAAWKKLLAEATRTPDGRARIALAFSLAQWPVWTTAGTAPPAAGDIPGWTAAMIKTATVMPDFTIEGLLMYESRGGPITGTVGADYARSWSNADPAYVAVVNRLYADAGLDLKADLGRIADAPRVPANPQAAAFWQDSAARTPRGRPLMPVFRMHTLGDPGINVAQTEVYQTLTMASGKADLYRRAYVERVGHCNFTLAESAAAVEIMMRRLDTGRWEDVSPASLNAVGSSLNTATEPRFVSYSLRPFNGQWRLKAP